MGAPKTEQFSEIQRDHARIGKAISSVARVAIIQHLANHGFATNKQIQMVVQLSETAVHQHLQILVKTGFVKHGYNLEFHSYFLSPLGAADLQKIEWLLATNL